MRWEHSLGVTRCKVIKSIQREPVVTGLLAFSMSLSFPSLLAPAWLCICFSLHEFIALSMLFILLGRAVHRSKFQEPCVIVSAHRHFFGPEPRKSHICFKMLLTDVTCAPIQSPSPTFADHCTVGLFGIRVLLCFAYYLHHLNSYFSSFCVCVCRYMHFRVVFTPGYIQHERSLCSFLSSIFKNGLPLLPFWC